MKNMNRLMEIDLLVSEDTPKNQLVEIKNIIKEYATIQKMENMGVKSLAYPVENLGKKHLKAQYINAIVEVKQNKTDYHTLSSKLLANNNVLRYLITPVNQ